MEKMKMRKHKIIGLLIFSFLISLMFSIGMKDKMLIQPKTSIDITAQLEKNEDSLGTEIWLDTILINNSPISFHNIRLGPGWSLYDDKLVFTGNEPSKLSITIPKYLDVDIIFNKHNYSGLAAIEVNDKTSTIDLFSNDGSNYVMSVENTLNMPIYISMINFIVLSSLIYVTLFLALKYKLENLIIPVAIYILLAYVIGVQGKQQFLFSLISFVPFFVLNYKKNKIHIMLISLLIWFISKLFIQPLNFHYSSESIKLLYTFVQMSFFSVILFVINFIEHFISQYKSNERYRKWFLFTLIYFGINLIVLLLVWPGNWIWDEKSILIYAQSYSFYGWQSYLMVLIYSWSLMFIPFIVGIVLSQMVVVSFIVGYVLEKVSELYKKNYYIVILLMLLSLPPILMNNLYPLRATLYSYLELLFVFKVFYLSKTKAKLTVHNLIFFSFSILVLSFWRTEGIYYLVLGPLAILFIFRKQMNSKRTLLSFLASFLFVGAVYFPFYQLKKSHPNNYLLTIYVNPLSMMFQEDIKISKEDLNNINSVLDVEILKQNPSYNEIPAFFKGVVREDYKEHLSSFNATYMKVILNNIPLFINARLKTLFATSGLDKNYASNSVGGIYASSTTLEEKEIENMVNNDMLSKPINYEFRDKAISIFKGVDEQNHFTLMGSIIWNFIPMIVVMILLFGYFLIKKKFNYVLLLVLVLAKIPLIFITAPANYFFYYFSIYLIGIMIIGILMSQMIEKRKLKGVTHEHS